MDDNRPLSIIDQFHDLYYRSSQTTWRDTFWLGRPVSKCPLDLWVYQEILYELRPDLIVETGTHFGGSALFLASICDLLACGEVLSVDRTRKGSLPDHPRISYLTGSSISEEIVQQVRQRAEARNVVMVILDSDHREAHVLDELTLYSSLVTPGSYLIVEDTNINGHPVYPEFGPGPMEAVQAFLKRNKDFVADTYREKLLLTFNPSGYLKRRRAEES